MDTARSTFELERFWPFLEPLLWTRMRRCNKTNKIVKIRTSSASTWTYAIVVLSSVGDNAVSALVLFVCAFGFFDVSVRLCRHLFY